MVGGATATTTILYALGSRLQAIDLVGGAESGEREGVCKSLCRRLPSPPSPRLPPTPAATARQVGVAGGQAHGGRLAAFIARARWGAAQYSILLCPFCRRRYPAPVTLPLLRRAFAASAVFAIFALKCRRRGSAALCVLCALCGKAVAVAVAVAVSKRPNGRGRGRFGIIGKTVESGRSSAYTCVSCEKRRGTHYATER